MTDTNYTNGVIAVKEKALLGEKLLRFTEMSAQEVLRALSESGFGGEAQDAEGICEAEERVLDAFIREYAPTKAEKIYLLAPRDFHNAKAICKAKRLNAEAEKMLSSEGMIPVETLTEAIGNGDFASLGAELGGAAKEALEREEISGAEIGALFDKALFRYLACTLKYRAIFRTLLAKKADMTNILTALRATSFEQAEPLFVDGGKLGAKELSKLFSSDMDGGDALKGTPYEEFYALCMRAREKSIPYTEAERALESFEAEYFYEKRYALEGKEPFLYYVFRRRAEIQNVRIVLVCLGAELPSYDIKRRLRAI